MTIYTDGASSRKNGVGAFGIYIPSTGYSLVKKVENISNNFAELAAFICALKVGLEHMATAVQPAEVTIVTDSTYVKNGYETYMYDWDIPTRLNGDLWAIIFELKERKGAKFTVRHCRGHGKGENDSPEDVAGNDVVDKLVFKACQP